MPSEAADVTSSKRPSSLATGHGVIDWVALVDPTRPEFRWAILAEAVVTVEPLSFKVYFGRYRC